MGGTITRFGLNGRNKASGYFCPLDNADIPVATVWRNHAEYFVIGANVFAVNQYGLSHAGSPCQLMGGTTNKARI